MKRHGMLKVKFWLIVTIFLFYSCNGPDNNSTDTTPKNNSTVVTLKPAPAFNADSAYSFIKAQVDIGPRIPGSKAHAACADYLMQKFRAYKLEVILQQGPAKTFDGKQFTIKNIIAAYNPNAANRILICSHWDTRPFADEDTADKNKPFDGANDGASGVGVALELARIIAEKQPNVGVDFILFDLEDYGESRNNESWCIGSQYWAANMHKPGYYANFGVLLDMVGGANAMFVKEGYSVRYAPGVVDKVWNTAQQLGYGNYFVPEIKNFVGIDDHIYINRAGIPCIDIIEYNPKTGGFGDYHHTHKDNMAIIDKSTLKAVGQTLAQLIYLE